jgi:hypothetical protein
MKTVASLIEDLQKLPPDSEITFQVTIAVKENQNTEEAPVE